MVDNREYVLNQLSNAFFKNSITSYLYVKGFIEDFFQKKENNHERIVAGIEDAKKRGTKFGRKCMQKPHEFEKLKLEWKCGTLSSRNAAKQLGISQDTFLRWVKEDG
ncbi:MAG TPA: hypothetical protein IAD15_09165 [Candidatus Fimiplasma intestinipullorum]|uniref:Uncharacterized protein n=1 Tax=Candidatus Fimiplasma intestinipullorum TaxID=2840825 RepID=A0A9D1HPL7_9FIRM|nr:hypothetical protein [Candidatus Fimiplasma intestinipullorum]